MNPLELFNHRLNKSLKTNTHKFSVFNNIINQALKNTIRTLKNKQNACVLGAGKMQEFSLSFLLSNFKRVYVTDVDYNTIKEVTTTMDLTTQQQQRLKLKRVEYTGFEQANFFTDFQTELKNRQTYTEIDAFLNKKLHQIKDYHFLPNITCDFVYVSLLYTQLVYYQLLEECAKLRTQNYPEHLLKYIEETMLDKMILIIQQFNKNVLDLVNNDGILFVISDILEIDNTSKFSRRIKNAITHKEIMDSIYQEYQDEYGMGLGDFGLYDLDQTLETRLEKWLLWPVSNEKNYVVKLKIYNKFKKEE
ncbi:MAG: hypothetical protein K9L74_04150 [Candidatus Izimaplasma sp.]|nr:hypothetical protein [Candidatus Izimaplasma bacterium]